MNHAGTTTRSSPRRTLPSRRALVVALIALVCLLMSLNAFVVRYSEGGVHDAPSVWRAALLAAEPWIPWLLLAIPLAWLFNAVTVLHGPRWRFCLVHGLTACAIASALVWGWDRITDPLLRTVRRDAMMDLLRASVPAAILANLRDVSGDGTSSSPGFLSLEFAAVPVEDSGFSLPGLDSGDLEPSDVQIFTAADAPPFDGLHFTSPARHDFLPALSTHFLAYLVLLALTQGLLFYREMTRGREETALMRARYDRMRLDSLRSHIDPHFLYNALTAISAASREDGEGARLMIGDLSSLMRASSAREGSLRCTLREELELAAAYANLIRRRYSQRFEVQLDVPDEALACYVPAWTVQPLLENVVVHGVHGTRDKVTTRVEASLEDGELLLVVSDDAPRNVVPEPHVGGTALDNLRERLEALFGPAASLEAAPGSERGFCTTIRVPQRVEDGDER